jgi:hypothetical protein
MDLSMSGSLRVVLVVGYLSEYNRLLNTVFPYPIILECSVIAVDIADEVEVKRKVIS